MEKQFKGDLEAESKGQMLSSSTEVQGSAGYVAMERVSGTLRGHRGTFVLQHNGTMNTGCAPIDCPSSDGLRDRRTRRPGWQHDYHDY